MTARPHTGGRRRDAVSIHIPLEERMTGLLVMPPLWAARSFNSHTARGADDGSWDSVICALRAVSIHIPLEERMTASGPWTHASTTCFNSHTARGADDGVRVASISVSITPFQFTYRSRSG